MKQTSPCILTGLEIKNLQIIRINIIKDGVVWSCANIIKLIKPKKSNGTTKRGAC